MEQKACLSAQTSASGTHLFRLGSGQVSGGIPRQAFVARSLARLPLRLLVVVSFLLLVARSPARLPLLLPLVAALLCLLLAARRCSPSKQLTVAMPPVYVHRETGRGPGPAPRRTCACPASLILGPWSFSGRGNRVTNFLTTIEHAAFGAGVRGCKEFVHGGIPIQASRSKNISVCIVCADERGREALDAPLSSEKKRACSGARPAERKSVRCSSQREAGQKKRACRGSHTMTRTPTRAQSCEMLVTIMPCRSWRQHWASIRGHWKRHAEWSFAQVRTSSLRTVCSPAWATRTSTCQKTFVGKGLEASSTLLWLPVTVLATNQLT